MAVAEAAPTSRRLESLDFVRGCALFGILTYGAQPAFRKNVPNVMEPAAA